MEAGKGRVSNSESRRTIYKAGFRALNKEQEGEQKERGAERDDGQRLGSLPENQGERVCDLWPKTRS